ncbi:MAG: hypothetical protein Q8J74_13635, partial [Candidatus Didemnitutus sp.]|nr:hypothetical protein [Candidatus Didemnitutus sp.]
MKSLFTILALGLVALALPSPVMARLGESEKELIARFGEPVGRSKHNVVLPDQIIELGPTLIFRQGDWRMKCDLVAGRCLRINYSKPGEWIEDQIQLVLGTNAQGSAWTETGKPEAV